MNFEDRISAYPNRYVVTAEDGSVSYIVLERADEPVKTGTPLNAETFNEMFAEIKKYASDTVNTVTAESLAKKINGEILPWLPKNGMAITEIPGGFFAYSTNLEKRPGLGIPQGFSEYGTFFGVSATTYGVYLYKDVFGKLAVYNTHEGYWVSMVNTDTNTTYSLAREDIQGATKVSLQGNDGTVSTVSVPKTLEVVCSAAPNSPNYKAPAGLQPKFWVLTIDTGTGVVTTTVNANAVDRGFTTYTVPSNGQCTKLTVTSAIGGYEFFAEYAQILYIEGYA